MIIGDIGVLRWLHILAMVYWLGVILPRFSGHPC